MDLSTLQPLLKSEIVKTALTALSAWLVARLTSQNAHLVSYTSRLQTVHVPPKANAAGYAVITFSLFLWNQGKAAAKDVEVGHHYLPDHTVDPHVRHQVLPTPGGGHVIHFPMIPPKTLITVTYLVTNPQAPVISHVTYERGPAQVIQVNLQRVFSKWIQLSLGVLAVIGIYTVIGLLMHLFLYLASRP